MVARKDIERAFGILKKRWHILSMPCRLYEKDQIRNVMYMCIILHNMSLEDEGRAIVEYYGEEPESNNEDINDEERTQNQYLIESRQINSNLRADLVEHVSTLPRFDCNEDEDETD
ncbi:putative harbinger transposase-derived protein [Helianthus annuus]|nr:putative harbinger transposase-derived protein [Helianthus annuus]